MTVLRLGQEINAPLRGMEGDTYLHTYMQRRSWPVGSFSRV